MKYRITLFMIVAVMMLGYGIYVMAMMKIAAGWEKYLGTIFIGFSVLLFCLDALMQFLIPKYKILMIVQAIAFISALIVLKIMWK